MTSVGKKRLNMIEDNPNTVLLRFAVPIILGNLFQQFYNMVDSIVVGKFVGEEALASVGASYAVTNVFIAIAIGGGIGSSVIISQYFGAGKLKEMKTSVYTALWNFAGVGLALSLLGLIACRWILTALNTPENVLADAVTYLRIYFCGLTFLFMYNIMSSIFNSLGDSQTPLKLLIFSSLLNIVLDVAFVVAFHMGVAGVAVATLIAQGFSSCLSFTILRRRMREYRTDQCRLYSPQISRKMVTVAIPSIIQQSIVHIGMLLVQSVVNGFGSSVLAGYSAGTRYESICIVPMVAAGNAVSTFTAQNVGAGKTDRVKKGIRSGMRIVIFFAVILAVVFRLFTHSFLLAFLDPGAGNEAFATGSAYLRFICLFYVCIGAKCCADGVLRGSGDVLAFTLANLVNLTIRVSFAHIFAPVIGIQAVWYAVPIGWTANFLISFSWYLTGRWEKRRVI